MSNVAPGSDFNSTNTNDHEPASSNGPSRILQLGYYAVAVLDVLGQTAELARLPQLPGDDEGRKKAETTIHRTFGRVYAVRRYLAGAFEHWKGVEVNGSARRTCSIRSFSFADTVVAFTSVQEEPAGVLGAMGLMVTCAIALLRLLAKGIPVRGGIEVGWAGEFGDGPTHVYGPALVLAHGLESRVAQFPRVVIGPMLVHYLRSQSEGASLGEDARLTQQAAGKCLCGITSDIDGVTILNCLSELIRSQVGGALDLHAEAKKALGFLHREHGRFHRSGEQKLAARYALAMAHFASALGRRDWA